MAHIRLISTDFDGTLIGYPSDGKCAPAFADVIGRHIASGGLWAVNTGRSLPHIIEGLEVFGCPHWPDFLLTHERHIFRRRTDGSWEDHGAWNDTCQRRHAELFGSARSIFGSVEKLSRTIGGVTLLYEDENPAGLTTISDEVMDEVLVHLDREVAGLPHFGYQRNSIHLRFCHRDYHKGSALGELCRLEDIPVREVMAAGDHCNDLSMLDGRYAGMPACPANAIEAVKDLVRRSGGYVARRDWAEGVAEAIRHYQDKKEGGTRLVPESRLEGVN